MAKRWKISKSNQAIMNELGITEDCIDWTVMEDFAGNKNLVMSLFLPPGKCFDHGTHSDSIIDGNQNLKERLLAIEDCTDLDCEWCHMIGSPEDNIEEIKENAAKYGLPFYGMTDTGYWYGFKDEKQLEEWRALAEIPI